MKIKRSINFFGGQRPFNKEPLWMRWWAGRARMKVVEPLAFVYPSLIIPSFHKCCKLIQPKAVLSFPTYIVSYKLENVCKTLWTFGVSADLLELTAKKVHSMKNMLQFICEQILEDGFNRNFLFLIVFYIFLTASKRKFRRSCSAY